MLVKATLERYRDTIWRRYEGVVGTAIGSAVHARDRYVIIVFLKDAAGRPTSRKSIAGVPLVFKVSGMVTTLPAPAG